MDSDWVSISLLFISWKKIILKMIQKKMFLARCHCGVNSASFNREKDFKNFIFNRYLTFGGTGPLDNRRDEFTLHANFKLDFPAGLPSNTCVFFQTEGTCQRSTQMPHGTELLSYLTKTSQSSLQRLLEPHKPSEFQRDVWSEASTLTHTLQDGFCYLRVRTEWQVGHLFQEQSICLE